MPFSLSPAAAASQVVPKSLLSQWEAEIKTHLGGLARTGGVHIFYGKGKKAAGTPERLRRFEFVLTTYDTVRNSCGAPRRAAAPAKAGAGEGHVWTLSDGEGEEDDRFHSSRRICGNRITSRIAGLSVRSITSRSMPMPQPPVGGRPYSSARM